MTEKPPTGQANSLYFREVKLHKALIRALHIQLRNREQVESSLLQDWVTAAPEERVGSMLRARGVRIPVPRQAVPHIGSSRAASTT
eukprot:1156850-Pelagomonas_calceolata.AAC.15